MNNAYLINYINDKINQLNYKFPNYISEQQREYFIKNNVTENMTESEVQDKIKYIDQLFEQITKQQEKIQELRKELARELQKKKEEKLEQPKIFGQTYKSNLIEIFKMYDEIQKTQNLSDSEKKELLEKQIAEFIPKSKEEFRNFLMMQTQDQSLIDYGMKAMFLGYETLNYDTISNLKEIFNRDLNLVQCESEGKLKMTLPGNQQIFDSNGNINPNLTFDFSRIKTIYDYAKANGKQIKHHELLWHNSVPENLRKEIERVDGLTISEQEKQNLKRNMCLKFYDYYFSKLSNFFTENGYDIRQIDALNEIANDLSPLEYKRLSDELIKLEEEAKFDTNPESIEIRNKRIEEINNKLKNGQGAFRESFWSQNIGNNPQNGDAYFIDILRMAKQYFPNSELVYNDYNEFIGYKCDRMCEIIKYIQTIEKRDGMKLIDGLGLQAHYRDFVPELGRNLTPEDIMETAVKFMKLGIPLYICEYDFNKETNMDISPLVNTFAEIYGIGANGFNAWGNSDHITWEHCLDQAGNYLNSHIIDEYGNKKEAYYILQNNFFGLNRNALNNMQSELNENAKQYLRIILKEYGQYMSIDTSNYEKDENGFIKNIDEFISNNNNLISSNIIKIDSNPLAYFENQRNDILNKLNLSESEKQEKLKDIKSPSAHGGQVFGDRMIHIYPSYYIDPKNPLTIEQIKNKCDELIVHEILHYFIRPEKVNEQQIGIDKINNFITEGLVDMCARDLMQKYGIHQEYTSGYARNVVFMREALSHIESSSDKMKLIFQGSIKDIYERTSTEKFDSLSELKKVKNKESDFDNLVYGISERLDGNAKKADNGTVRAIYEIAANSKNNSQAIKNIGDVADRDYSKVSNVIHEEIDKYKQIHPIETNIKFENKEAVQQLKDNQDIKIKKGPEFKTFKFLKANREKNQSEITEHKTEKSEVYQAQVNETSKKNENTITNNKVKKLTPPKPSNGGSSSNGFVDTLILTLIVGFVAGAVFMIVYNLIK